jgi:hypothetical protein
VSVRPEPAFRLPDHTRPSWRLWIIAAAVHVPLVVLLIVGPKSSVPAPVDVRTIVLNAAVPVVAMPYAFGSRRPRTSRLPIATVVPAPANAPVSPLPRRVAASVPSTVVTQAVVPAAPIDTPPAGRSLLQPKYGDGRLWVQPLIESPRQIASALTGKAPADLADSAVTAMVQTYLDQMAKERAENPTALPSWTTKIAGKTVGVDQKWIYLGPIKVPTALLALLPIKLQSNPTQAEFNRKLQQMRSDLLEAARRSENYEEFKKAVKDLHDQKEREREFKKNQRTRPDTSRRG